ncbi:MAG: helix-turn-helix domain-containing protein [Pseudomonadota bacterium]
MQAKSLNNFFRAYNEDMKPGRPARSQRSKFGERICALREAAGLTQQQVAELLGITQPCYAWWERKEVALRPEQLTQLAKTLGVRIENLMEEPQNSLRRGGPVGRARRVFETVSQMPRHRQQKIIEVVEALVAQHTSEHRSGS